MNKIKRPRRITADDIKHPGTYDEYLRNRVAHETYSQYIRRMGYVKR